MGGIGLHLSCDHVLGIWKALNDPLGVIVDDAVQDDLFKVSHGQTGILPVVMCSPLLIVRLNDTLALQVLLVALLYQIEEFLYQTLQLWSVRREIDNFNPQLCNLFKILGCILAAHVGDERSREHITVPVLFLNRDTEPTTP